MGHSSLPQAGKFIFNTENQDLLNSIIKDIKMRKAELFKDELPLYERLRLLTLYLVGTLIFAMVYQDKHDRHDRTRKHLYPYDRESVEELINSKTIAEAIPVLGAAALDGRLVFSFNLINRQEFSAEPGRNPGLNTLPQLQDLFNRFHILKEPPQAVIVEVLEARNKGGSRRCVCRRSLDMHQVFNCRTVER